MNVFFFFFFSCCIRDNCLRHLTYNKYKWEEYCRDRRTVEIPMKIQNIRTDSASCRLLLFHLFVPKGCKLVPNASDESPETLFEGRPICESKSLGKLFLPSRVCVCASRALAS